MAKRLTKEEFIEKSKEKHGDNYSFEKTDFNVGGRLTNIFICLKHNREITHLNGNVFLRVNTPCLKCREEYTKNKCIKAHGDRFDYGHTNFSLPLWRHLNQFNCKKHGLFKISIGNHIRAKNGGCIKCDKEHMSSSQRQTIGEFVKKAKAKHKNQYTYEYIHQFKNMHEKVWINCDLHGLFHQTPANHTHKTKPQGCPQCRWLTISEKNSSDLENFIKKANNVHKNKYDYTSSIYSLSKNPIEIFCKKHEKFFNQTPNDHLSGKGCPDCAKEKIIEANTYLTSEMIRNRCKEVWGETYDYSKTSWENTN